MLHLIVFTTTNGMNKYNLGVLHLRNLLAILGTVNISHKSVILMECALRCFFLKKKAMN